MFANRYITVHKHYLGLMMFLIVFTFSGLLYAQSRSENEDYSDLFSDMKSTSAVSAKGIDFSGEHISTVPVSTLKQNYYGRGISPLVNTLYMKIVEGDLSAYSGVGLECNVDSQAQVKNTLYTDEVYITYQIERLKITAGNIVYAWGSADELNPTDTLNPRDERNPYDIKKLPLTSMFAALSPFKNFTFEGIIVPHKQKNIRLKDEVEFIPEEIFSFQTRINPEDGAPVYYQKKNVHYQNEGYTLRNTRYAVRIQHRSSCFDLALSYIYDIDQNVTPHTSLAQNNLMENSVYLIESMTLFRETIHRIGTDFKTNLNRYGLWVESCASIPNTISHNSDTRRKDEYEVTLGGDCTYGNQDRGYCNLQANLRYIPNFDNDYFSDYKDGRPDVSSLSDKEYMSRYYSRSLIYGMSGQYSILRSTLMLHNEWIFILNRFTLQTNLGYQLPSGYAELDKIKYGAVVSNLQAAFTLQDSLLFTLGVNQTLQLEYDSNSNKYLIDRSSELNNLYESNYIYMQLSYKWNK